MRETVPGASHQIDFPSRNHAQNAKHSAISKNAAARNIAREGSAAKLIGSYPSGKLARVRLANATSDSMTGTSTSTPTTVAGAAPLVSPNRPMATATASSKKLEVPISAPGAAMSFGPFKRPEESRVGAECVNTGRARGSQYL